VRASGSSSSVRTTTAYRRRSCSFTASATTAASGSPEIGLGLLVLIVPATSVLLFVLGWKLGTEFLFVTSGAYGGLEVIERASSYAAPIAAILCRQIVRSEDEACDSRRRVGIAPDAAAPS
jgi:hypothetical protein